MKKLVLTLLAAAFTLASSAETVAISGVSARQRWPWNNLVDVDFTLAADAGALYRVAVEAKSAAKGATYHATTFANDPVAKAGANRITWDFGADYPNLRASDMKFAVAVAPYTDSSAPLYVVIDLSAGPDAASYPVRYTSQAPAHVQGATDEKCQTTELWLRRVRKTSQPELFFGFTEPSAATDGRYWGEITHDYYIGVFEMTQAQYALVTGEYPSYFAKEDCRASRPVENLVFGSQVAGTTHNVRLDPAAITATSLLGKLRAKTGLPINVPTLAEAHWAARGALVGYPAVGREHYWYYVKNGEGYRQTALKEIARCKDNCGSYTGQAGGTDGYLSRNTVDDATVATAPVGAYLPNELGLYDLIGNVTEYTAESANAWYSSPMGHFAEKFRSEDATLGMTAANPLKDYLGYDAHTVYQTGYGPSFREGDSLWNLYIAESGNWIALCNWGVRVMFPVGE
ncbi:MAG: SUMF1/EgtB/PvdO family nonheme iron enzyme [Kiritimatiellia bacterium]